MGSSAQVDDGEFVMMLMTCWTDTDKNFSKVTAHVRST